MSDTLDIAYERISGGRVQVTARNGAVQFADRCDPGSARSRRALLRELAQQLPAIDIDEIEKRLLEIAAETAAPPTAADELGDPNQASDEALKSMPKEVVDEARAMLLAPDLIARVARDIEAVGVVGEHALALTLYLIGTSRILAKPLAGIVQGSSSSGKSHTVECVSALFPAEATLLATDMTPNALYYVRKGGLRHRFVVAGERSRAEEDDRAEATRALREMLSSGVLRKALPQKSEDGVIETVQIENPGPIAFVETTTLADIFEEDRNRALLLASDDSCEQTQRVVHAIAQRYAGQTGHDADRIRDRHRAAQRILRRVDVVVPFAPAIAERIPHDRPDARRVIGQVLATVQAVAALHQFQRVQQPQHGATIAATAADYKVARQLLVGPVGRALGGGLPEHVRSLAAWLRTATKAGEAFTLPDLLGRDGCRWSRSSLYDLTKPLRAAGFLAEAGQDGRSTRYRIAGTLPDAGETWLPDSEAIAEVRA